VVDVSTYSIIKGSSYDKGVSIPIAAQVLANGYYNSTIFQSSPNLLMKFNIGNVKAYSSSGTHWVFNDHPLYSILKPWWISFFTLGKLVENTQTIPTFLSPGFCPYTQMIGKEEHLSISRAIQSFISSEKGELNFLMPTASNIKATNKETSDGFIKLSTENNFSDVWVKVDLKNGDEYIYKQQFLTENYQIFLIMIISVVIPLLVSLKLTLFLIKLLFEGFKAIRIRAYHIELYWKIFSKVSNSNRKDTNGLNFEEEDNDPMMKRQSNEFNFNKNYSFIDLPSISNFIGFLLFELFSRSGGKSLQQFYALAFEEDKDSKLKEIEGHQPSKDKIPLKMFQGIYQQMCFLLNYRENDLTSTQSLEMLRERGMMLTTSETQVPYLIRLTLNMNTDLSLNYLKNNMKKSSLALFLDKFCSRTNFDEDKIPLETFTERYGLFCKLNHMEQVLIDHILLKNEYGIESRTFLKEIIEVDPDQVPLRNAQETINLGCFGRTMGWLHSLCHKKKFYNLQLERLKNINLFLAGKLNYSDVRKEEYQKIVESSILEKNWARIDFFSVVFELFIAGLLSFPFISIFIFQEIEHSIYSLREESRNIYGFNFQTNDIWLLFEKIFKNMTLMIVFILFLFFWFSTLINMVVNIVNYDFPWIKVFDPFKPSTRTIFKLLNAYQWVYMFISFWVLLFYICVVVVWDILACIINSQAYLATTAMGISLAYLISSFNVSYRKSISEGRVRFRNEYKEMWNLRLRLIVKKMIKFIKEAGGLVGREEGYNGAEITELSHLEDNVVSIEANLKKIAEEQPDTATFMNFFISLIHRDPKLRTHTEMYMMGPPMNFNYFTAQFLCNTLFMPKSFKIDKFGIEKNMNLCASVIFYYKDEIELVPLALKDIGELRVCDCPPDTPISTNYMCSNCSGRDSPYNNQEVKDSIRNRKISENSKIMVYMLDILSNLQKRRIPQVIKIIEKTFLEAYNEKIFFQIQPIFNMIHLLVFYLDENFDNSNLTSTVLDFLKNSLKVDMALTEILMIYLLKDSHMLENQKGDIYDSENISSIFKRQICSSSNNSKENKMLVKFLSISTSFLSSEPQISEDLIIEIAKDVNQNSSNVIMLPNVLFHNMIHFPLYMTQTQASISQKIAKHAFNSSITSEISGLMYHFTMVSTDLQYSRKEFENFLRKSPTFAQIKDHFGLSFKEMFGVIYLMRGDTNSEHFDKVLTNILKKYNLVGMKKHLDLLIILYSSYNPTKTKEALRIFAKWCTAGEEQFFILLKIFVYFKGIIKSDEKLLISFGDFFELLPSKKVENDPKLKAMFIDCIHQRNFSKFKNFKENILYVNKNKGSGKTKNEGELIPLIDIIELFFIISNGADINEMLAKLKSFIPDFESKNLLNLSSKLMKTVHGFKTSHKDILSERLKEAFKTLGEISMGRPNDFEQLWMFIYSSDHTGKLQAIKYFDKKPSQQSSVELEDNRLKSHSIFIDKRVRFIRNQNNFLDSFSEYCSNPSYKFGVAMLKRTHLKNLRLSKTQTTLILGSIIQKLDPSIKIENSSIARFFSAFFDFVIREDSTQLGNYFLEEHDEPMLNILTFCKNCPTPNERMNKIFEQLMANGHQKLCSLMYFYQLILGQIHRRKITLKTELEREINQWLNIKPEFFEFLELYMDRDESNLVEMIFRIQNRILFNNPIKDKSSIQEGILTREFYETIQAVIKGEQPSIQFLADLFKIPLKKLKFLHILTTLKLNTKYENVFEQLNNNLEVKKLLEAQVVSSQELVFLLKICLNNIDYDSIADFLRLMKLDNIIVPEILINLLLLDVNVPKEFIPMRDFNQIFLVHSAIFERLGLLRELCWAFCRVLKGDFINFNKLINVFNDDNLPQNHKYFSKIITGMIGLKNYHFSDPKTMKALHTGGLPAYNNLLTDHFQRFSKGEKENSYEYAQYLLFNGFNIHPFWGLFCNLCKEQPNAPPIEAEPPKVGLFKNLTLMQLISITNILHCDEAVIEFLYDFSMFRNILAFLIEKRNAKERFLHSTLIDSYHEDMIRFYEEQVNNCKQIMKEMIKDKRILFNYEHFKSIKSPLFQRMMIEICKNENLVQESDFYCPLNKLIFQHWKEQLHSRMILATIDKEEKDWIHKLIDKIEDLLSDFKLMIKDPFKMFVTKENVTSKDYWDRKFEELDYFDNFLVSLVDLFMKSLDTMTPVLNQYGLTGAEFLVEEIALNLSMESQKSNKDPDLLEEDKKSASEVEVEDLGVKKGYDRRRGCFLRGRQGRRDKLVCEVDRFRPLCLA
jgi:hypothetical protein